MDVLRIIPLGGLGEVGKNMTVYESGDERIVVDAGMSFPRDEHLGVDVILPDFGYLRDRGAIRAVVLTHAHEDHVGALPFLMREVRVQEIWATRLTLGLVKSKLDEHGLLRSAELREVDPEGAPVEIGPFRLEFIRMAHSIPDAVGIAIETRAGRVFHSGDWKLDHTPVDGLKTDVGRLADLGNRGVDLLCGDSTNAERPGFTRSERVVGEAFRQIIPVRRGRILVSSFASNIHRMQQAIDVGVDCGRSVVVVGRSMRRNMNVARNLGYVEVPEDALVKPADLDEVPVDRQLILCTGSQGEPLSALRRMAYRDHPQVKLRHGDTVVFSATPVPGNERAVNETIDRLYHIGCDVVTARDAPVHASGHGYAEEVKLMLNLTKPRYVMPFHGDFKRLRLHTQLAEAVGIEPEDIFQGENGLPLDIDERGARFKEHEQSGMVFVDGVEIGDMADVALRDRRMLSADGIFIVVVTIAEQDGRSVADPEVIFRGVPFPEEAGELFEEIRSTVDATLARAAKEQIREVDLLQQMLHDDLAKLVYDRLRRRPMVLPVVVEV